MDVTEHEVEIRTPGGSADAVLFRAGDRERPGVIFLTDAAGPRPSQRQMAHSIAADGYNVLLPNIYYRSGKPPFFEPKPDFTNERTKARLAELTSKLPPAAMESDGSAYAGFLASQRRASDGPIGVVGFCFTGQFALRIAAARPDRIAAAASFHGGRLYQDDPSSPHTVLPRVKARLYFGHARDDRSMPAEAIRKFEEALAAWGGMYESETYDARHGWTVPDSAAYDEREAERAFRKLRELFAAALR